MIIFFLLMILLSSSVKTKAQEIDIQIDNVLDVTQAARTLVSDLLDEEASQRMLIDSLLYQNIRDSLTIIQMLRIQNAQKVRLMALSEQIEQTRLSHDDLINEIEKIKPEYSDVIIPASGALVGAFLYNGDSAEKAVIGLIIYGSLITIKHFGVY